MLISALAVALGAIAVWALSLRPQTRRRIPAAQRPFWSAFSLGLTLWAIAAVYPLFERATGLVFVLPISEAASIAALASWLIALFLLRDVVPLVAAVGPVLGALGVVLAGISLAERLFGMIGGAAVAPGWHSDKHGGLIAAGTSLSWHALYVCVAVALWAAVVLLRYMSDTAIAPGLALALAAMPVALLGGWDWWGAYQSALPTFFVRVLVVALAVAAMIAATRTSQRNANPVWLRFAPWVPVAAAAAVIAMLVLALSPRGPVALQPFSFEGDVTARVTFAGAFLSLLLVAARGGVAAMQAGRLQRERQVLAGQNEEYVRLAISDPLTRLFNKGYFDYRLRVEWERSQRSQQPISLIALDLDNFKQVNDRFGHAKGDKLLVEVGGIVRSAVRGIDCPCRVGGDEFIVILPQTDRQGAATVAERLRVQVGTVLKKLNLSPLVSVSCGVSVYPDSASSAAELVEQADAALYKAKQSGKNAVVLWPSAQESLPGPQSS